MLVAWDVITEICTGVIAGGVKARMSAKLRLADAVGMNLPVDEDFRRACYIGSPLEVASIRSGLTMISGAGDAVGGPTDKDVLAEAAGPRKGAVALAKNLFIGRTAEAVLGLHVTSEQRYAV